MIRRKFVHFVATVINRYRTNAGGSGGGIGAGVNNRLLENGSNRLTETGSARLLEIS